MNPDMGWLEAAANAREEARERREQRQIQLANMAATIAAGLVQTCPDDSPGAIASQALKVARAIVAALDQEQADARTQAAAKRFDQALKKEAKP